MLLHSSEFRWVVVASLFPRHLLFWWHMDHCALLFRLDEAALLR